MLDFFWIFNVGLLVYLLKEKNDIGLRTALLIEYCQINFINVDHTGLISDFIDFYRPDLIRDFNEFCKRLGFQ